MTIRDIPAFNATLIKTGRKEAHRKVMTTAMVVSALFLVGYVTHKVLIRGVHTPFGGTSAIRTVYYTMLISHIFLAISIAYLVPRTFLLAIKGEYERHKAWAKWTFPIWYYVSVTGVLVYFFLYQWWPAAR
jgi:uncharacterized membrane protein YozB (DUF420 family)